eukprot:CAMPEP_0174239746 /NCGR_PEP_ID=MMETSP0417-20130205/16019_1 /TAXON_ID=242541 /ORGANISM="Mayorella sp, Strain BSH-02190019" /LENGTH=87 /DNA_ID=CAMNT_0015318725 /DNA_START=1064 /DNA_END=1327 /DNA_ORIENTATION=-
MCAAAELQTAARCARGIGGREEDPRSDHEQEKFTTPPCECEEKHTNKYASDSECRRGQPAKRAGDADAWPESRLSTAGEVVAVLLIW